MTALNYVQITVLAMVIRWVLFNLNRPPTTEGEVHVLAGGDRDKVKLSMPSLQAKGCGNRPVSSAILCAGHEEPATASHDREGQCWFRPHLGQ